MTRNSSLVALQRHLVWLSMMVALTTSPALAQTAGNPQAARQSGNPLLIDPEREAAMEAADKTAKPLAARGRKVSPLRSQNELYNINRTAEGRLGVRVGGDMSYRVEKKAGEP